MIFNNIETLKISGNEVQSIITLNGEIIYQKEEENNDYILIQNNNVIEDYADIYTLSDLSSYFRYNTDINKVKLTLPTATECFAMFWQCSALTSADLNLPNATNCNHMFYYCSALTSVNLNLPNAISCTNMFAGCNVLTSVDLDLPSADNCTRMFDECRVLTSVDLDLPSAVSCGKMFQNCSALVNVKLNIPEATYLTNIFNNASNLETIDVTIPTSKVSDFKSYINSLNLEHLTSLVINGTEYIYYDSASVDNSARYTPCVVEGGNPRTIQFNTDKYEFPPSTGQNTAFVSSVNVPNNCTIEADLYSFKDLGDGLGIGFGNVTDSGKANYSGLAISNRYASWYNYFNQFREPYYWNENIPNVSDKWTHIEILKTNNDVTITLTDDTNNIIFNTTETIPPSVREENCYLALFSSSSGYIKNIKITKL